MKHRAHLRSLKTGKNRGKKKPIGYRLVILILVLIIGGLIYKDFAFDERTAELFASTSNFLKKSSKTLTSALKVPKEAKVKPKIKTEKAVPVFEFYDTKKTKEAKRYFLDILFTDNFKLADKVRAHVTLLGFPVNIKLKNKRYLVTSGPYHSSEGAKQAQSRLKQHKVSSKLVVVDP